MKTDFVFAAADEHKDAIIHYQAVGGVFQESDGIVVSHTQGVAGNGAEITYIAPADIGDGEIGIEEFRVSSVTVYHPVSGDSQTFDYRPHSWDPLTLEFEVYPAQYSTPTQSAALEFSVADHGWQAATLQTVGSSPDIEVRGIGSFLTQGISPGLDLGRTFVFTKAFTPTEIAEGEHINRRVARLLGRISQITDEQYADAPFKRGVWVREIAGQIHEAE